MLPFVGSHRELVTNFTEAVPGMFNPSSILGTYPGEPPLIEATRTTPMCMNRLSNTSHPQEPIPNTPNVVNTHLIFLPYTINQTPFLYPPPSFVSYQVMTTLILPNMYFRIPILYLATQAMIEN